MGEKSNNGTSQPAELNQSGPSPASSQIYKLRASSERSAQLCDSVFVCQMADMAGLKYLSTALETMTDPENPECESEGWLLEKGVKETFVEMIGKLKTLGRANQVEEGGDAPEAAT